jgi:O-acetyl-ADP-ribose deacetylase (regulator of RNase III)
MKVVVAIGDVLETPSDVLISTANPWLNMSGGVNGAIRERCPEIQAELRAHLASIGRPSVPAGTVVRTSAGALPFAHIIHAIAIDPFYDSTIELVGKTLIAAFDLAVSLGARSVTLPTLATGYGPMSIADFAHAFANSVAGRVDLDTAFIVVRSSENAETINSVLERFRERRSDA